MSDLISFSSSSFDCALLFGKLTINRGRLVQERATKEPKLNCRNWECGVLIPVISRGDVVSEQNRSPNDESGTMLDIFEGIVPVPMRLPAPQYGPNRKPWFNSESGM